MSKERDKSFELFWHVDGDDPVSIHQLRDNVKKKDAKAIWDAAFKEGGRMPWHSVTKEQLIALFNHHGLTKK
jgi:hypothetical protein